MANIKKLPLKWKFLIIFGALLCIFFFLASNVSADRTVYVCDTDDGYLFQVNNVYLGAWNSPIGTLQTGTSSISIGQKFSWPQYTIYRTILFFNTASLNLTQQNITGANLRFYVSNDLSTTDFDITVMKVTPNKPLQTNDYDFNKWSGGRAPFFYGMVNTGDIQPYATSYLEIELSQVWINTILNENGFTIIGLRSGREMSQIPPIAQEHIMIWSANYGTPRYEPELRIYYKNYSDFNGTNWYNTSDERNVANCSVDYQYWEHNDTYIQTGVNTLGGRDYGEGSWFLVSLPKNETVSKFDVYVRNATNNYTWAQAVTNGVILTFLYNWTGSVYDDTDNFTAYQGFWLWFYETDYSLWINGTVGNGTGGVTFNMTNIVEWINAQAGLSFDATQFNFFILIIMVMVFTALGEMADCKNPDKGKREYFRRAVSFFIVCVLCLFGGVANTQTFPWYYSFILITMAGFYGFRSFLNFGNIKKEKDIS